MAINALIGLMGRPVQPVNVAAPRLQNAHATLYEEQAERQRQAAAQEQADRQVLQQALGSSEGLTPKAIAMVSQQSPVAGQKLNAMYLDQQKNAREEAESKLKNRETEAKTANEEFRQYQERAGAWSNVATGILRNAEKLQDPRQKAEAVVQGLWDAAANKLIDGPRAYEMYQFIQTNGYTPQVEQMLRAVQANGIKPADQLEMDFAKEQAEQRAAKERRDIKEFETKLPGMAADAQYAQDKVAGKTPEQTLAREKFVVDKWSADQNALHAKNMEDISRGNQAITMRGQDMTDARMREMNQFNRENKPPTGLESTALGFYQRAAKSAETLESFEDQIRKKGLFGQGVYVLAPNVMQPEVNQQYKAAQRQFTEARLRKDSGAAIPNHEYENDARMYFVQPGDSEAVLQQKAAARAQVIESLRAASGRAYSRYTGEALPTAANAPLTPGAPVRPPIGDPTDELAKKFGGKRIGQ